MELWTEMRTALTVGRLGTVRSAADVLEVHRATVSRHIDTLEERLGAKLFLRHKDGYSLTDAGHSMMQAAEKAEQAIVDFVAGLQTRENGLSGTLKVSAVSRAGQVIRAATQKFCDKHPRANVHFEATSRLPSLETREVDVALRAGRKPTHPDYVVTHYYSFDIALYGHRDYLERVGFPKDEADLERHRFVGRIAAFSDFDLRPSVKEFLIEKRTALDSSDPTMIFDGIIGGLGLGLASKVEARQVPELVEVLPGKTTVLANVWIITHVDAHRSPLVQEFIACLKSVRPWNESKQPSVAPPADRRAG